MRLVSFEREGAVRPGVADGDEIVDLAAAAPSLPGDLAGILGDPAALETAREATASGKGRLPLGEVALRAPIARPGKYLAAGLNYADHVAEMGHEPPSHPTIFSKVSSCVVGPGDAVEVPIASDRLDFEGELGFVVGRRCRHVGRDEARDVIAGYFVANDVSVRDWQRRTSQYLLGKSFDTHGPIGPWIVTADEVRDPHALDIRTWVNGELRQESNTRELIHDCFDLLAVISTACTLEPGDIVATGTPAGVAAGEASPRWLKPGDVVRIEIEGIGVLENPIIAEAAAR